MRLPVSESFKTEGFENAGRRPSSEIPVGSTYFYTPVKILPYNATMYRSSHGGFTLIELLVVIAIIGILASIVFASLGSARTQAQQAATVAQLREIKQAILRLELDTDKSVGGCPIGVISGSGNELSIAVSLRTGLSTAPTDLTAYGSCQWTVADVAKWRGPYISTPIDPWGNEYYYDSDYYPRQDNGGSCANPYPPGVPYAVVVSGGPNGVNGGSAAGGPYDCDDIFMFLN